MVEPLCKRCEASGGVLSVVERMKRAGQRGLEIAQHGVDPFELGQVSGLQRTDDPRHVETTGIGHGSNAAQAIAEHDRLWR